MFVRGLLLWWSGFALLLGCLPCADVWRALLLVEVYSTFMFALLWLLCGVCSTSVLCLLYFWAVWSAGVCGLVRHSYCSPPAARCGGQASLASLPPEAGPETGTKKPGATDSPDRRTTLILTHGEEDAPFPGPGSAPSNTHRKGLPSAHNHRISCTPAIALPTQTGQHRSRVKPAEIPAMRHLARCHKCVPIQREAAEVGEDSDRNMAEHFPREVGESGDRSRWLRARGCGPGARFLGRSCCLRARGCGPGARC